jgi:hypothetical protein
MTAQEQHIKNAIDSLILASESAEPWVASNVASVLADIRGLASQAYPQPARVAAELLVQIEAGQAEQGQSRSDRLLKVGLTSLQEAGSIQ